METIAAFLNGVVGEDITLRTRQYGARDAETGWPAITYATSTIKAHVREQGTTVRDTPDGGVTEQRARMFTLTEIPMRDQIIYDGHYWEVEDVQMPHYLLGNVGYYNYTLIKLEAVP